VSTHQQSEYLGTSYYVCPSKTTDRDACSQVIARLKTDLYSIQRKIRNLQIAKMGPLLIGGRTPVSLRSPMDKFYYGTPRNYLLSNFADIRKNNKPPPLRMPGRPYAGISSLHRSSHLQTGRRISISHMSNLMTMAEKRSYRRSMFIVPECPSIEPGTRFSLDQVAGNSTLFFRTSQVLQGQVQLSSSQARIVRNCPSGYLY
jgi:hypothetical protein